MKYVKTFESFQINESDDKHNYMMLSRLQSDCDYFLGNGSGSVRNLYYDTVEEHIAEMKRLWDGLPEKPEWLSYEEIENYEQEMLSYNKVEEKSKEAKMVLQEMDKDEEPNYEKIVAEVVKETGVDKDKLEKELEKYI